MDKANKTIRAIAWDPIRPGTLWLPVAEGGVPVGHYLSVQCGAGCNEFELEALYRIIDVHESTHHTRPVRLGTILMDYRASISDCIGAWSDALAEEEVQTTTGPSENDPRDAFHLELLQANYAVLHLSHVILPLLATEPEMWEEDPFARPGLATASFVRYLRHNHLPDIETEYPVLPTLLQAAQPERFQDNVFWTIVKKLVLRGCLEQAWDVLRKHSLFQTSLEIRDATDPPPHDPPRMLDPQYHASLKEIHESFLEIRELLLRAPLPGGRTDLYDDCLEQADSDDVMAEAASYLFDDLEVTVDDYKLWDSNPSSDTDDISLHFQAESANRKHSLFREFVRSYRNEAATITRLIPEIDEILRILAGELRGISFQTWAEAMLANLLYRQPAILPRNLAARATHLMKEVGGPTGPLVPALLEILQGDAAKALDLINISGGGSGAALPATMLALLFTLSLNVGILPLESSERCIEFVCEAAASIQSSLSRTPYQDQGIHLVLRLLIPYAMTEESIIRSTMAMYLEHYTPSTITDAQTCLQLCRPFLTRKSLQILNACCTMLIALHRQLLREGQIEAAIVVLLDGIEAEGLVLDDSNRSLGYCYMTLAALCGKSMDSLLSWALDSDKVPMTDNRSIFTANEIAKTLDGHAIMRTMSEARLIVHGPPLVEALMAGQDVSTRITQLLLEDVDPETGVILPRAYHWNILRAAQLSIEALRGDETAVEAGFGTKGIQILMELFFHFTAFETVDVEGMKSSAVQPYQHSSNHREEVTAMEKTLADGLARAFVKENAARKHLVKPRLHPMATANTTIKAPDIHSSSDDVLERYINSLLNH